MTEREVIEIAGVGELVDRDHAFAVADERADQGRADEPGTTGHDRGHAVVLEEIGLLGQPRQSAIAVGNGYGFGAERPADRQRRIVPGNTALVRWTIKIADFVLHFGIVLERAVPMCKAWRHPDLMPVVGTQHRLGAMTKSRRSASDVDGHIED